MHARTVTTLVASILTTVPAVVLGVGFFFHTSYGGTILGKYSARYSVLLVAWVAVVLPLSVLLYRFLVRTHQVRLSGGRTASVRPRHKIVGLIVCLAAIFLGISLYLSHFVSQRTTSLVKDKFHPYLQNVPNPDSRKLGVNSMGFRGPEIKQKKSKRTFRVFVFGGSTVFCGSVRTPETPWGLLQRQLRETYPDARVQVLNVGGDWHTSQHSLMKLLFQVQDYAPDLVIIYHAVNDLSRSLVPDAFAKGTYRPDYGHYYGAASSLIDPDAAKASVLRLYFGCWFSDFRFDTVALLGPKGDGVGGVRVLYYPRSRPIEITEWPSLEPYERNMRDFVAIARDKGSAVMLATQPSIYRPDLGEAERGVMIFPPSHGVDGEKPSVASMMGGMQAFNAKTVEIADDLGVEVVDLDGAIPKTLEYFYDDVHYTIAGCRLIADAMHERIVATNVVPTTLATRRKTRDR